MFGRKGNAVDIVDDFLRIGEHGYEFHPSSTSGIALRFGQCNRDGTGRVLVSAYDVLRDLFGLLGIADYEVGRYESTSTVPVDVLAVLVLDPLLSPVDSHRLIVNDGLLPFGTLGRRTDEFLEHHQVVLRILRVRMIHGWIYVEYAVEIGGLGIISQRVDVVVTDIVHCIDTVYYALFIRLVARTDEYECTIQYRTHIDSDQRRHIGLESDLILRCFDIVPIRIRRQPVLER